MVGRVKSGEMTVANAIGDQLRMQIEQATNIQRVRNPNQRMNRWITEKEADDILYLDKAPKRFYLDAIERLNLSQRSASRLLRVARTVADLANSSTIEIEHLAEAFRYRPQLSMQQGG